MTDADQELEQVREMARLAARAAASKGGENTLAIEVGPVLGICDVFVITSGSNLRQVASIAEEVQVRVREAGGGRPKRVEGLQYAEWVLVDYGDFVVHVFLDETRHYYELERLWSDRDVITWDDTPAAVE